MGKLTETMPITGIPPYSWGIHSWDDCE